MKQRIALISIICSILLIRCQTEKQTQQSIKVAIPVFSADSAYSFVAKQVSFGPRTVGSEPHIKCRNWLSQKLKEFGFEVQEQAFTAQSFDRKTLKGVNIIGRYNKNIKERVLLAAHWDSRHIAEKDSIRKEEPILGADDGGSGVGVILEIARQIQLSPIPMGLDIVFFDAEDQGNQKDEYSWALGSQYWSKNLPEKNYEIKYGILLDMVGAKDAVFYKEYYSMQIAPTVVNAVWKLANEMGKGKYFNPAQKSSAIDDHLFVYRGSKLPMIDIINMDENGFGKHHHTHNDNLEIIDKRTLGAVGQVVLAVVYSESNQQFKK
jgi:Zn-dependent M28 family amino/carboxypeptidase